MKKFFVWMAIACVGSGIAVAQDNNEGYKKLF